MMRWMVDGGWWIFGVLTRGWLISAVFGWDGPSIGTTGLDNAHLATEATAAGRIGRGQAEDRGLDECFFPRVVEICFPKWWSMSGPRALASRETSSRDTITSSVVGCGRWPIHLKLLSRILPPQIHFFVHLASCFVYLLVYLPPRKRPQLTTLLRQLLLGTSMHRDPTHKHLGRPKKPQKPLKHS